MYFKIVLSIPFVYLIVHMFTRILGALDSGVVAQIRTGLEIVRADSPFHFGLSIFTHVVLIIVGFLVLYRLFIGDPFQKFIKNQEDDKE
jgi:uncharacterized membrane protein YuzA (DUF378 family)